MSFLNGLYWKSNSKGLGRTLPTLSHLTTRSRLTFDPKPHKPIPVTIEGRPPEMAFDPKYLADALQIGPTLRLVDKLNPGMATGPSGNFCVLMSLRFTEETGTEDTASGTLASAIAA